MIKLGLKTVWSKDRLARFERRVNEGLRNPGTEPVVESMFRQWLDFFSTWTIKRFNRLSRSGGGGEWPPLAASTIYARSRQSVKRASQHYVVGETVNVGKGDSKRDVVVTEKMREAKLTTARKRATKALNDIFNHNNKGLSEPYGWNMVSGREKLHDYAGLQARGDTRRMAQVSGGVSVLVDTGTLRNALDLGAPGNITQRRGASVEYGIGGSAREPAHGEHVRDYVTIGQLASYHQNGGGHLPQRQILVTPHAGDAIYARMVRAARDMLKKLWELTP